MDFLCAVSGRFPENYEIGRRAGVWGVEEKYQPKIAKTSVGDHIIFIVAGEFRAIHRITSKVHFDDTVLWPLKDGSAFPYRVEMSEPLYQGSTAVSQLASRISFMRSKQSWGGTIQGPNGVFNDHMTREDFSLIRDSMKAYRAPAIRPQLVPQDAAPEISLRVFEDQVRAALGRLLDDLGLVRAGAHEGADELDKYRDSSGLTLLARDRTSGALVVLAMDTGEGGPGLILQILRQISALRQKLEKAREIRGLILTARVREDLRLVANEIPNLSVRTYRMRFELDSEPEAGNGWQVA